MPAQNNSNTTASALNVSRIRRGVMGVDDESVENIADVPPLGSIRIVSLDPRDFVVGKWRGFVNPSRDLLRALDDKKALIGGSTDKQRNRIPKTAR